MQESRRRRRLELRLLPLIGLAAALALQCRPSGEAATPPPPAPAPQRAAAPEAPAEPGSEEPAAPPSAPAGDGGLNLGAPPRRVAAGDGGAAPSTAPPPLPKDTTVLHIGDSFAAALGIELNKKLKSQGVRGVLKYETASFIPGWAWGKMLPVWLAQTNPDLVIITLGANEVAIKKPETRAGAIKKLVGKLGGRPCVWIGIPLWKEGNGLLEVIRENAKPCRYMDSNRLVPNMKRVKDGIHPTMKERERWAGIVVDWLARKRQPDAERVWELSPDP